MIKKAPNIQKIIKACAYGLVLSSLFAIEGQSQTLEDLQIKAEKLQASINKIQKQEQQLESKLENIEKEHGEKLSTLTPRGVAAYDSKIEAAKKQNNKEKKAEKAANKTQEQSALVEQSKPEKTYPMERAPRYVAPQKSNKGRRPFTKSDNDYNQDKIYYASRKNSEELFFAKEEIKAYTGTTEENVFVFSDNLANYCEIDTKSLDKMSECLNDIIKKRSGGSQSLKQQVNDMYQESLIDTTSHSIADAARYKNDSSGYEKNVLLPLQEKSSQATDERGDIEVLTLTEMEALKLKNKILQIYANQLGLDAFRDFGTYEVNNRDLTNIDAQ